MSMTTLERPRTAESLALAPVVDAESLRTIKNTIARDFSDTELHFVQAVSNELGLSPLTRDIYFVKQQGRIVTMVGIDGFRKAAMNSGKLCGIQGPLYCGPDEVWRDAWLSETPPVACKVGVIRSDWDDIRWFTILYKEFVVPTNPNWKQRPVHMLGIRAEAHALRSAFPLKFRGVELMDEDAPAGSARVREERPQGRSLPERVATAEQHSSYAGATGAAPRGALVEMPQDPKAVCAGLAKRLGWTGNLAARYKATVGDNPPAEVAAQWALIRERLEAAVEAKAASFALWAEICASPRWEGQGKDDREQRLATWGDLIGHGIESTSDLTAGEWERLVVELRDLRDRFAPGNALEEAEAPIDAEIVGGDPSVPPQPGLLLDDGSAEDE